MKADRQGDVVLIPTNTPYNFKIASHVKPKNGRIVLAEGEVTGHAHTMDANSVKLFEMPFTGRSILVVQETTVRVGQLIEGKVIGTMPGGTIRFQCTDGTVIRFLPEDIQTTPQGVIVQRAFTPLTHDEHDAIPLSKGQYEVHIHHTADHMARRERVVD